MMTALSWGPDIRKSNRIIESPQSTDKHCMQTGLSDIFWVHCCCRPAYWDVVFVLAGERIPLHRAVLAARSSYFHRMLRTAWLPPKVLLGRLISKIRRWQQLAGLPFV